MLVHSAGESVGYGLLNEMLDEHRRLRQRGDFLIFPQLQLRWNPRNPRDLRSNLPDLGLGRLIPPDGRLYIQGGAEHKRPILPLMSGLPPLATVHRNSEARDAFASAIKQASDQMKVVIKNGAAPQDEVISWIISVCPYFIVKSFGPFNQAVLLEDIDQTPVEMFKLQKLLKRLWNRTEAKSRSPFISFVLLLI